VLHAGPYLARQATALARKVHDAMGELPGLFAQFPAGQGCPGPTCSRDQALVQRADPAAAGRGNTVHSALRSRGVYGRVPQYGLLGPCPPRVPGLDPAGEFRSQVVDRDAGVWTVAQNHLDDSLGLVTHQCQRTRRVAVAQVPPTIAREYVQWFCSADDLLASAKVDQVLLSVRC